jgi:hypothetical protein
LQKSNKILETDVADVVAAHDVATDAHTGQARRHTGDPYISHPKEVQRLAKEMGYGLDIQIIALLHDAIENSKNPEKMKLVIEKRFGASILKSVMWLTHSKADTSYIQYLIAMAMSSDVAAIRAFKVKMLDMHHNLSENPSSKQKEKYRNALVKLMEKGFKDKIPQILLDTLEIKEMLAEAPKDPPEPPKDDKQPKGPAGKDPFGGGAGSPGGDPFSGGGAGAPAGGDPFSDAGGEGGPGGPGGEEGGDKENSISKYNDLSAAKVIKFSRQEPDPGFDFSQPNVEFYTDNYVASSKDGSLMIATPKITSNRDIDALNFLKSVIIPQINESVKKALAATKRVVVIGDYGLPFDGKTYQNNEQGVIARYLNGKYPKGYVKFDTWNPKDYYSFISDTKIWTELKTRTEAKGSELKAAMYLNAILTGNNELKAKLESKDVAKLCKEWGFDPASTDKKQLLQVLHPEEFEQPQTLPSLIVNTYAYLLRVRLLEKINRYEKSGNVVIVPIDSTTSWILKDSFEKMEEMKPGQSEEEPEGGESEPEGEDGAEKEKKEPKEKEKK